MVSVAQKKLPVINMEDLQPGSKSWKLTCQEVRHSLEEYGCFMAVYDGVSQQLKNQVFDDIKPLFDLPKETKLKNISDKPFHGYAPPHPLYPLYEAFGIQDVTNLDGVQSFANLMWPSTANDTFSKTMHSYAKLVSQLQNTVIKMVFESYKVEKYYDAYCESMTYLLKVMKYKSANSETNLGAGAHTDKNFLSILCQNKVNGLEVQLKNQEWVNVDFLPSSFVVMATDSLMACSNGRLRSPHHRVVMKGKEDRYSLAFFTYIKGINIEIPKEFVDEDHPPKFKPLDHFKFLDFFAKDMTCVDERVIKLFCGV